MKQNNNLENQFRKKLNDRIIKPSDKAWDRLDAMLSVSEKKKPKSNWIWIAASLVVFATIGSFFLKTDKNGIILDENRVVDQKHNHYQEIITDHSPEILIETKETFALSEKEFNEKTIPKDSFRIVQNIGILPRYEDKNNFDFKGENTDTDTDIAATDIEIDTNIESNTYITAQDLLNSIKDEEHTVEGNNKPAVSIDHRSLLYQAEMEVEQQYRKNAIDRFLDKNYDNVKVAVLNKL